MDRSFTFSLIIIVSPSKKGKRRKKKKEKENTQSRHSHATLRERIDRGIRGLRAVEPRKTEAVFPTRIET